MGRYFPNRLWPTGLMHFALLSEFITTLQLRIFFFRSVDYIPLGGFRALGTKSAHLTGEAVAMNDPTGPQRFSKWSHTSAKAWQHVRTRFDEQHSPGLFWVTVIVLGVASLLCVALGASHALARMGSEKSLQVNVLFPKLKGSVQKIANVFRRPEAEFKQTVQPKALTVLPAIVEQPHDKTVNVGIVPPPTLERPTNVPELPRITLPKLDVIPKPELVDLNTDPLVYRKQRPKPLGDSIMIHTWKTLTLYSLLSAVTLIDMPQAIFGGGTKTQEKVDAPDLSLLKDEIKAMSERIAKLEKKREEAIEKGFKKLEDAFTENLGKSTEEINSSIGKLNKEIVNIKKDLLTQRLEMDKLAESLGKLPNTVTSNSPPAPLLPPVADKLLDEIRKLSSNIENVIAKLPTEKRPSMYPSNGAATVNAGRVMLINLYSEDILFIVNGNRYVVPPRSQKQLENVPAGTLTYEVAANRWGVLSRPTTTNLNSNETFTLTASR